jgi:hypothetical protein
MSLSPFFHHLRSAYQAELDDLTSDTEGSNILAKKLTERRKELGFLLNMMEISPEMVAVVFHQAFRFKRSAVMEDLIRQESEDLPEWDSVRDAVDLMHWAQPLSEEVLAQANGPWFMTVAACLEYLLHKPDARSGDHEDSHSEDDEHDNPSSDAEGLDEDERQSRVSEQEGAAWLIEQGFDAKD